MTPPAPARPAPLPEVLPEGFTPEETVRLPLVGSRTYVRALDVLALLTQRFPSLRSCRLSFRQPLQPNLRIGLDRAAGAAASATVLDEAGRHSFFLANADGPATRIGEPPLCWHATLPPSGPSRRYLVPGPESDHRKLEVVFAGFQAASGIRYLVRSLEIERTPSLPLDLLRVTPETGDDARRVTFRLLKDGRPWCRIGAIPSDSPA